MQLRNVVALTGAILSTLVLAACQVEESGAPDLQVTRITADDLADVASGAQLALQAADRDDVLLFDPSHGSLDFGKIELTCPNGQQMGMDRWLTELGRSHGVDLGEMTADTFSIARTKQTAADGLDSPDKGSNAASWDEGCVRVCAEESCYLCTDGQWICSCIKWVYDCGGALPLAP